MERSQFINGAKFKTRNSAVMVIHQLPGSEGGVITICSPEYSMQYTDRLHIEFRKMGIILWNYIGQIEVTSKLIRYSQIEFLVEASTPSQKEPSVQGA